MGLVGVAENGGRLPVQGRGEGTVAEVGLGAVAGSEVVRGAPDRDLHAPRVVDLEERMRHAAAQLPFCWWALWGRSSVMVVRPGARPCSWNP